MIILSRPGKAGKVARSLPDDGRWCYIGKDARVRSRISGILGEERRFFLGRRLQKIAERLREPFLDFVAAIGEKQADPVNWWASRFASKSPFQTDFFLLLCYKALIQELLQDKQQGKLVLFIEDPWLFRETRKETSKRDARSFGLPCLFGHRWFLLSKGIAYRILIPCWFLVARTVALYYHGGLKPQALHSHEKAVSVLSYAEARAFKDGLYTEKYMSGLDQFCIRSGIPFFYLYAVPFPLSTLKYLRKNSAILWPIILDCRLLDVLKRTLSVWAPSIGTTTNRSVAGVAVGNLLSREWWLEFSGASFVLWLIFFEGMSRFFSKSWTSTLLYVFENQPWEKLLCMAARKAGIKSVGYQHSSIWRLYLSQFPGKGEVSIMPLPDRVITSGPRFAALYRENGLPGEKVLVGGAWRYLRLLEEGKQTSAPQATHTGKPIILVALSVDASISTAMIENLFAAGIFSPPREVWIKPHPDVPVSRLKVREEVLSRCRIVTEPLDQLFDKVDVVITSTSTAGLEAFLSGRKVVSFVPENLLAADPLLDVSHEGIYVWYEGEEFNRKFLEGPAPSDEKPQTETFFSRVDADVWKEWLVP